MNGSNLYKNLWNRMFASMSSRSRSNSSQSSLFRTNSSESINSLNTPLQSNYFTTPSAVSSSSPNFSLSSFLKTNRQPVRDEYTVESFLDTIGRNCKEHASKFTSFDQMLSMKSEQMKKLGIPTKQRKWILLWTERWRLGMPIYAIPKKDSSKKK